MPLRTSGICRHKTRAFPTDEPPHPAHLSPCSAMDADGWKEGVMTTIETRRQAGRPTVRTWIEPTAWARELQEFTRRNAGRRARLEVDDPALGAQTQERDDTILGVVYDPRDGGIQIMLGDIEGGDRHHVRSIGGVTSVDLLSGSSGRDLVLRIAHGHGRVQTLLTLLG